MTQKTIATYTLGCKVNQYETNAVEEMFTENGYELVDFEDVADVYLINTCTVTAVSDKKSRQIIRRAKKHNPEAIVAVMGCYAQNEPESVLEIEGVNLVIGTKDKDIIFDKIKHLNKDSKEVYVTDIMKEKEFENLNISHYSKNTRAFVKIQDGCDRYCSYCIIPYTRGRIRSRKPEDIIYEVKNLAENGYKEVVLTGIHVASYGKDFKNIMQIQDDPEEKFKTDSKIYESQQLSLINVIEEIAKIDGIKRIRTSSVEPLIINDDFLKRLSQIEKFCPHFHLSLQSGCDETLKRMNRRYTTKIYKESVEKIRKYFELPAITTDVIVGFPGETDEEFNKTYEFLKDINLYEMHIFPFSRRSGTKAYDMKDQIDKQTKHERSEILINLANENKQKFEKLHLGKQEDVLFEQEVDGMYEGFTKNYVKVHVHSNENISGEILKVKFNEIKDNKLIGEIIK